MFEDMEQDYIRTQNSSWIDKVVWFERPWIKKLRQLKAGQYQRYSVVRTYHNII